jgi:hypothetical protein
MNNIVMAPSAQRSDFLRTLDFVAKAMGLTTAEAVQASFNVYDDVLVMPQALLPTSSSYNFNPVTGVDTPVYGENKMDKNDWFAIWGVGLRFQKADYASGTGLLSNHGNYDKHTYPYAQVFNGAAAGGAKSEADALKTVLGGILTLTVSSNQQWQIPASELVYENVQYTGGDFTPSFGGSVGKRGVFPLSSIVVLNGGTDNKLTLTLAPAGDKTRIDGSVTGSTTRNLVVPMLFGLRIKNMANGGYSPLACRA